MPWALLIPLAFLSGSIPFGVLLARARGVDLRAHGSGNVGATNVGRVLGRRFGMLCFFLDAAKGSAPVVLAGLSRGIWGQRVAEIPMGELWLWLAVGVAALLGHVFSPWIGFRGGKGVATGFGAFVSMWTPLTIPALLALLIWVVVVKLSRMVSLASILAALSMPVAIAVRSLIAAQPEQSLRASVPLLAVATTIALFVIWKHRSNIRRIMRGEELKVQV